MIACSPRRGNSDWMLNNVIKGIRASHKGCRKIVLRERDIKICDGCLTCEQTGKCHVVDDMNSILNQLSLADGLIFAIPVHFDSVPGPLKNFIDRLNPLLLDRRLKGKKMGLLVVGQLTGKEGKSSRRKVVNYMKNLAKIFDMKFVGSVEARGRLVGDLPKDIAEICFKFGRDFGRVQGDNSH